MKIAYIVFGFCILMLVGSIILFDWAAKKVKKINMKSIINWQTGTPTEFGDYLTIRKSRRDGTLRMANNQYASDEVCNYPLPKNLPQGWQVQVTDGSDIIAWVKIDDIKIIEENECKTSL